MLNREELINNMEDKALLRHDLLILEVKKKMAIARENGYIKAWKDLKRYYDRLIQQKKIYCELKGIKYEHC